MKYKIDILQIDDWATKNDHYQTWDYTVKGLKIFGLDREKVMIFIGPMSNEMLSIFDTLWEMLLQVDPRYIKKTYPTPRFTFHIYL